MKAVRLVRPRQPLEDAEIPLPAVGPEEVMVRVRAAGICHSDAHYRAGISPAGPLPLTLGHEVAGVVDRRGDEVADLAEGERVCLHYLVTCGACAYCRGGTEQFCPSGAMIGKHRDGGFAEFIAVPARCAFRLPDEIPFEQGAVLMCSAATALHALRKARLADGESVAVFGMGGLGASAVQLAAALGASPVFAVDVNGRKLALARRYGAVPVDAGAGDPVEEIRRLTDGGGVDVALELIGLPETMAQAVRSLANLGRAALVGITDRALRLMPYEDLLNREAEVIGVSDHLASEIPELLEAVRRGWLDLSRVVSRTVPLEAGAINDALDRLERFSEDVRVVVVP